MLDFLTSRTVAVFLSTCALLTMTCVLSACWDIGQPVPVEGNYDLVYDDVIRVYLDDDLLVELDAMDGGEIPLGDDLAIAYDEICSGADTLCPSEAYWDEVAIYQPLGEDNALLNAVNIGTIGEEGTRLAGLVDDHGAFAMLLGLDLGASESCLAVGLSLAEGRFERLQEDEEMIYGDISGGVISVEYAAGCEIAPGVILAGALRLETGYEGIWTGPLETAHVRPDPAIDENGDPLGEDPYLD